MKTQTKITTIAVSVTAVPYENKNNNSHRHLVLQYIVASGRSYSSVMIFPIRHFVGNTECGGSNQVAVALVKIPFVKMNGSGKLSGGLFYIL